MDPADEMHICSLLHGMAGMDLVEPADEIFISLQVLVCANLKEPPELHVIWLLHGLDGVNLMDSADKIFFSLHWLLRILLHGAPLWLAHRSAAPYHSPLPLSPCCSASSNGLQCAPPPVHPLELYGSDDVECTGVGPWAKGACKAMR